MTGFLVFTILGSGSSGGVPRADGDWGACNPADPRNRRSRCSLLVHREAEQGLGAETTILVDTSPDLRTQTAAAGATRLDAVLWTHDHADQAHGIDDIRAFFIRARRRIPAFADAATVASLGRRFDYVFRGEAGYPAIADLHVLPPHGLYWTVQGPSGPIPVLSFDVDHGGASCCGYRFGPVGYVPDVLHMDAAAMAALEGVEVLIVDALRDTPHPTHANVAQALAWIEALKPRRAVLTNLHIDLDYAALAARLPPGVEPARDQLRFSVPISDNLP